MPIIRCLQDAIRKEGGGFLLARKKDKRYEKKKKICIKYSKNV